MGEGQNKRRYSNGKKAIAIFIQQLSFIGFVICFCVVLVGMERNYFTGDFTQKTYIETEYFQTEVKENISSLMNYLQLKYNFETDQQFDLDKIVDVKDYNESGKISGEVTEGEGYYLKDLIEWGKIGFKEYNDVMDVTDSSAQVAEGSTEEIITDSNSGETVYKTVYGQLKEEYLPVDGISLKEKYIDAGDLTSYNEIVQNLEETLGTLPESVTQYKKESTTYQEGKTNLSYIFINTEDGILYTNMNSKIAEIQQTVSQEAETDSGIEVEELKNIVMEQGTYLYYDVENQMYETTISGMKDDFYTDLDRYSIYGGSNCILIVGVDNSLPVHDEFYNSKERYEQVYPWCLACLIGSIIFGIMTLGSFVFLALVAGRVPTDDDVHLNLFDRVKGEFILGLVVLTFLGTEPVYDFISGRDLTSFQIIFLCTVYGTVASVLLLSSSLTGIRRIKSGTLFSNTITHMIFKLILAIFRNLRITLKTIFFVVGVEVMSLTALFIFNYKRSMVALMVFGIIQLLVLYKMLQCSIQREKILKGVTKIVEGKIDYKFSLKEFKGDYLRLSRELNLMSEGLESAVKASIKNERLKTDLITNVSHDIKTPLTSIINYVDLIKRENIQDDKIKGYIEVLEQKSQRLKYLTEDLVEASKISSGNITLEMEKINLVELIWQTGGEFSQKFEKNGLVLVQNLPENPVYIEADGKRIWRVIENLYNNVAKYAMENTRVYADLAVIDGVACFSIKNISHQSLNINADELTERFIRGDISRSTEGSGLGLSIAKNLTELQKGKFQIYLDGDLFKVTIEFAVLS